MDSDGRKFGRTDVTGRVATNDFTIGDRIDAKIALVLAGLGLARCSLTGWPKIGSIHRFATRETYDCVALTGAFQLSRTPSARGGGVGEGGGGGGGEKICETRERRGENECQ